MNNTTRKFTERIFKEYKKHPFVKFSEHNELLAMTLDAEFMMCVEDGEPEDLEVSEIIFAVEKKWLIDYINRDRSGWDEQRVIQWLREEYTSYDSEEIFITAMCESQIVMLEFN